MSTKQNADQYLYQDGKWIKAGRTMAVVSGGSPAPSASDDIIIKDIRISNTKEKLTITTYPISDNIVSLIKSNPNKVVLRFNRPYCRRRPQKENGSIIRWKGNKTNSYSFPDCINTLPEYLSHYKIPERNYFKNCLMFVTSADLKKDNLGNYIIKKVITYDQLKDFYKNTIFLALSEIYDINEYIPEAHHDQKLLSDFGKNVKYLSDESQGDIMTAWEASRAPLKNYLYFLQGTTCVTKGKSSRYPVLKDQSSRMESLSSYTQYINFPIWSLNNAIVSTLSFDISKYYNQKNAYSIIAYNMKSPARAKLPLFECGKAYNTSYDEVDFISKTYSYASAAAIREGNKQFRYKLNFAILKDDWETNTKTSFEKIFDKYDDKVINTELFYDYYVSWNNEDTWQDDENFKISSKGHDLTFSLITHIYNQK